MTGSLHLLRDHSAGSLLHARTCYFRTSVRIVLSAAICETTASVLMNMCDLFIVDSFRILAADQMDQWLSQ